MTFNSKAIILMATLLAGFTGNGCADYKDSQEPATVSQSYTDDDGQVLTNKDNCPGVVNHDQMDNDQDGKGDDCDTDDDNDGRLDLVDNCKWTWNYSQANFDLDAWGDDCDTDDDNDGVCDPGPMADRISLYIGVPVCAGWDNCQFAPNPGQEDLDEDEWGNVCDNDRDSDLISDEEDNCPDKRNYYQEDLDGDGKGDDCDDDDDGDGFCDPGPAPVMNALILVVQPTCSGVDNCPTVCNPDQKNTDWNDDDNSTAGDLFGDACDTDPEGDGTEDHRWYPDMACDDESNCTASPGLSDDGNDCTDDDCNATTGVVTHTWVENGISCDTDDNVCNGTEKCQNGLCVLTPTSFNDNNSCTIDACDPITEISHTPITCSDSNACTMDSCVPASGCSYVAISLNDSNMCTTDACDPITGPSHTAVNTNDNNACTTDACNISTGVITHVDTTDDSNMCTTDACNTSTGVTHTPISCDDGVSTTTDSCVPATGCVHTPVNPDMLTIMVTIPARGSPSATPPGDVYFYFNGAGSGGAASVANAGNSYTITKTILKSQACEWGVDIAVAQPSTLLFWDCPLNGTTQTKFTPSLLQTWVNGVLQTGVAKQDGSQCSGQGPGNYSLSPLQLGCAP